MQAIGENFKALHEIPFVVGAIDGSHISILAPEEHAANYYCRKKISLSIIASCSRPFML